jgi:hypothetical protein
MREEVLATPKALRSRRKHKKAQIDPRLIRWGITVVPVWKSGFIRRSCYCQSLAGDLEDGMW